MKEYIKHSKVTYNLMSFTGYKSLLIFSFLTEGPKSYDEIREYLKEQKYLRESVTEDTVRIYLNSLREVGCQINRVTIDGTVKYSMDTHPFQLKISSKQALSIIKLFKAIYREIDVYDLLSMQSLFEKISKYITNTKLKESVQSVSPLYNVPEKVIKSLVLYTRDKCVIVADYNSPNSGIKKVIIKTDKLFVSEGKLYLCGVSSEHGNYSNFLVSQIMTVPIVLTGEPELELNEPYHVGCEIKKNIDNFELLENEELIEQDDEKMIIEITSANKFEIMQRIMSLTTSCTVLYPNEFQTYIVECLQEMKEGYNEEQ